jgi:hypothetical protein
MTTPVIFKTNPCGPVDFKESSVTKALDASYLIADTKKDGAQLNLCVLPPEDAPAYSVHINWLGRSGKTFPALQGLLEGNGYAEVDLDGQLVNLVADQRWELFLADCVYPSGLMIQAEVMVKESTAAQTSGTLRRKTKVDPKRLEVHVFGVVPMSHILGHSEDTPFNVTHALMKYHNEHTVAQLKKFFPEIDWHVIETVDVFSMRDLKHVYETRREAGEEGLVVKDPLAVWTRGKKVGQWKMKPDERIDGHVSGLVWGTEGLSNEGKVIGFRVMLETGVEVDVTGLTEALKSDFTSKVIEENWKEPLHYEKVAAKDQEDILNPYDGWAVQVGYMEMTEDGSLRHPFFDCWRGTETDPKDKV